MADEVDESKISGIEEDVQGHYNSNWLACYTIYVYRFTLKYFSFMLSN